MAAIVNDRDALLSAAGSRLANVNLPTSVNATTVGGAAASTVVSNASTGANHAISTGNPHSTDLDAINNGVTYFRTTGNQVTGAGRAYNALNAADEYIKSLTSTQMTLVGSNPATGVVMDANGIRMYQASVQRVNIPVSGNPTFNGDITGNSSINITGQGRFDGVTSASGSTYAGVFNLSGGANHGIGGFATTGQGVYGNSNSGIAVLGLTSTGVGVRGQTTSSGTALEVLGRMTISDTGLVSNLYADNAKQLKGQIGNNLTFQRGTLTGTATATFTTTNKPGANSENRWMEIKIDATTLYIPVWT